MLEFKGNTMSNRNTDQIDIEAEKQGKAISKANKLRSYVAHLKRYHYCDGERFGTGMKHRHIGDGA